MYVGCVFSQEFLVWFRILQSLFLCRIGIKEKMEIPFTCIPPFPVTLVIFPPTRKKGESNKVTGKISGTSRKQGNNGIPSKYPPNDFIRNQAPYTAQHTAQYNIKKKYPLHHPHLSPPCTPRKGYINHNRRIPVGNYNQPGRRNAPKTAPTRAAEN